MKLSRQELTQKSNDLELLSYLNRFLPAWKDRSGQIRAITLPESDDSPIATNFLWYINRENDPVISHLKRIEKIETTHTHCDMEDSMGDFFKASLGEILAQLPQELKDQEGPFYVTTTQKACRPNYAGGLTQAITKVYRVSRQNL